MTEIGLEQFKLVHHTLSAMIAVMGLAGLVFLLQRPEIHPRYRVAATLLGMMALAGAYSYLRLFESWNGAFAVTGGTVKSTGHPFDATYRYGEWVFTAPLLLMAMLSLLRTAPRHAGSQLILPAVMAAGMVAATGAGHVFATVETRLFWVLLALGPFAAVLYHLYVSVAKAVHDQPGDARPLLRGARFAILVAWSAYLLVWAMPLFGVGGPITLVGAQLLYAGADLLALLGAGMLVFTAAVRKSAAEGPAIEQAAPLGRPAYRSGRRVEAEGHYG